MIYKKEILIPELLGNPECELEIHLTFIIVISLVNCIVRNLKTICNPGPDVREQRT